MPILKSPLQKARERLATAEEGLARWQATLDGHRATLAEAEACMGADALAATEPGEVDAISERLVRARSSIDVAAAAVGAASGDVVEARRAALTASASLVRDRSKAVRRDAKRHEDRTVELLAALTEHEGFEYSPAQFVAGVSGMGGGYQSVPTKADGLRGQAAKLDRLADEITAAGQSGTPDAEQVRRLLARADPEGPEAEALAAAQAMEGEQVDAWRAYGQAVEAARRAWLDDRREALIAENKTISVTQAADQAAAEWRAQVRQHPSQQGDGFEARPLDIDAWALEQLGAPVHRPDVLVGA